jgi:lipopolysaccharide transport system permease protein
VTSGIRDKVNSPISSNKNQAEIALRYVFCRVKSELKAESAKNYMGYLWWFAEPALLILVFYFVFGFLFKRGGEGFASSLVVGVTAWLWFSSSALKAMMSIQRESQLMLLVYMPKYIFPLVSVFTLLVKQIFVVILIFALLLLVDTPSSHWWGFILVFIVQFLLIVAVSLIFAAIIPFIPDLAIVIGAVLPMGMFVSGVFFSLNQIPEAYRTYFLLNPMAGLIEAYRDVLLNHTAPDYAYLFVVAGASLLAGFFGFWIMNKFDRMYPRLVN